MPHLAFILFSLAASSGILCMGLFAFIYRTGRSPLVKSYLLYLGIGVFQNAFPVFGLYAALALGGGHPLAPPYYFASTLSLGALTYAAPRFFLEFADIDFARGVKRAAIGACAIVVASSPLCFASGDSPALAYLSPSLGLAAFLVSMLYCQARLILAYSRIKDRVGRVGVPAILVYDLVCIAAGVVDSGFSGAQMAAGEWPRGLLLQPALFIIWNLLSLAWAFAYEASGSVARPASVEPDPARARRFGMTERELELSRLLASGAANKEMAAALGLSANTVRNHVHNIYEKTGARNRVELVRALCGADEEG
jgi:DNA-binding CsgD family transcriptional regulator